MRVAAVLAFAFRSAKPTAFRNPVDYLVGVTLSPARARGQISVVLTLIVGDGLVAEEETFNLLLTKCYTVWLKAQPEEYMARVLAQGDFSPMAGHEEGMQDLKRVLDSRVPLYRKADAIVDITGDTLAGSLAKLRATLPD